MDDFTPKQQLFIREYLADMNATQAAIRSGYSSKCAKEIGYELLTKPHIKSEIDKRLAERHRRLGITQERILAELAKVAFLNASDVVKVDEKGSVTVIPFDLLDPDDLAAVAEVSETTTMYGGSVKIKFHNKLQALELLGKQQGMFADKVELNVTGSFAEALAAARDRVKKAKK